jgi:hypothetical protein
MIQFRNRVAYQSNPAGTDLAAIGLRSEQLAANALRYQQGFMSIKCGLPIQQRLASTAWLDGEDSGGLGRPLSLAKQPSLSRRAHLAHRSESRSRMKSLEIVDRMKPAQNLDRYAQGQPTPWNIAGGLSSIEEKSLGLSSSRHTANPGNSGVPTVGNRPKSFMDQDTRERSLKFLRDGLHWSAVYFVFHRPGCAQGSQYAGYKNLRQSNTYCRWARIWISTLVLIVKGKNHRTCWWGNNCQDVKVLSGEMTKNEAIHTSVQLILRFGPVIWVIFRADFPMRAAFFEQHYWTTGWFHACWIKTITDKLQIAYDNEINKVLNCQLK